MALRPAKCPESLLSWKKWRRLKAQTTVEFSLIVIPFFAILFAIVDYAQIYFYNNALQNALREASRFATAGRIIQQSSGGNPVYVTNAGVTLPKAIDDPQGREASRNECIRWWFLSNCVINLPLSNIIITSAPTLNGDPPVVSGNGNTLLLTNFNHANSGPGAANDYVQVTATYQLSTITPLFTYLGGYSHGGSINIYPVRVSAIVKNEPAYLNFLHTNVYPDEYSPFYP